MQNNKLPRLSLIVCIITPFEILKGLMQSASLVDLSIDLMQLLIPNV